MNRFLMLIYHFFWTVTALVSLPFLPFVRERHLRQRVGFEFPKGATGDGSVWIHALSIGEVISARPLVSGLKEKYPDKDIVFSVTTSQGMKVARKELDGLVKALFIMPLDFWWLNRRLIRAIKPVLFVLVETDLWPGMIHSLRKSGAKSVLVNGRISPHTYRAYRRYAFVIKRMWNTLDLSLMQSDLDRERLLDIGITPDKVKTTGNLKFDRNWEPMGEEELRQWQESLHMGSGDTLWIAGSTHEGEEEPILDVFVRLMPFFERLRLIIAPRDITRGDEIKRLCMKRGLKSVLRTGIEIDPGPYDVLILDTIGELGRIYGTGDVSFVGGSLVPIGGHNLLEPASFGRPVLFGPYTHNFVLMSQLLIEAGGARRVGNEQNLYETMKGLLSDPDGAKAMGDRAKIFVESNTGALGRIMKEIESLLAAGSRENFTKID